MISRYMAECVWQIIDSYWFEIFKMPSFVPVLYGYELPQSYSILESHLAFA